ncbi:protein brunelleschi [Tribolium castaneum]|uniref:protein brunelleschi n=1 Tax=Tribolium castaneum TaxID=7070 RepID=UPI0000D56D82|nr:PREDICTED: protein brunelleschi [Tribolium castaneum]XP_008196944.1 PREDICTED: protein brunelleschi [Tribolium castaneum]XP_015838194.1 PREDICTED: protein brunelleschi [Tribolium castaneum]XP_970808.1 PREDICTED: protein brunelleschi [Tribolium castaneum]|eukprot:XP_008196943.1 PREDICTED: protein brunelleschi [Tribolium castaneum]
MRSSVSYILSSSTSEPNMSHPDYEQYSHDHAALLVLVRHIGSQLKPKTFQKFHDRIAKLTSVRITDSTGNVRTILVRYVKEHPVENNDWGDFQTHRRLLGLVSLGKYDSQQELNEICRVHESLKVKYTGTLFDSRCILFGPTKEASSSPEDTSSPNTDSSSSAPEENIEKFTTPSNFKTRGLFYDESAPCADLETQIIEFINSLFWVLESKRLERSREKLERVSLLLAPFEKKDFVGLDMESRNNKKKCTGRMTKHLGDLCLQAGLLAESLVYYGNAAETLKSVNDWLWLGAAYEGLCAASALVLYPEMQRSVQLQRNASLQEGSSPKKTVVASNLDVGAKKASVPNTLAPEDISKRYREAIIHYSKYQNAGIVETEASFKAARIAVEQNHSLQAASFLQNVVYINLTLSEQEKIQRFETLAELYTQIGFTRKAAFCQRLAATRYVSPQNPAPNWNRCYNLMLHSLPGHRLSLDPAEMREVEQGWPILQIQLLQELVVAAKRMGHSALATRHMTFLLQTMWQHLTPTEQKELAIQLQALSAQCEGSPVPLVLDSGVVIPPANLTNIPLCHSFVLRNLQPHLQPRKIQAVKQDTGPFLFTPIHFGSLDRRSTASQTKMAFLWVENEPCEVTLKLSNPLPFELKVSDMRLLTSGVVFESLPETVVLSPSGAPPSVTTLHGTPRESEGQLQLQGYSTHTLGVKSNCRLRHMNGFPPHYEVEIVPSLPLLEVKTSLPQSASFSSFHDYENVVTSASVSLHHGESAECTVTITNIGHVDVEMLEVSMQTVLEPALQEQMFTWSQENLLSQLPLKPNCSASLTLYLYAAGSFLVPGGTGNEFSSGVFSSSISGPGSLPSRLNSPTSSSFHRNVNSSFRSSNSGHSSMSATLQIPHLPINQQASSVVEGQLQIRYSGGPGLQASYCRCCSVFLTIETVPSLHVTNWDVLPAETNTQFYLVLDVANLTSQEMELQYTPSKTMLIEGHESCRVPVPVKRCPLSKLETGETLATGELDRICSEHIANLVDLRWHLLGTDTRGKASLKGLTLTNDMLDEVRMSPLLWEVTINNETVRPQEEVTCDAGDCLEMKIFVTNSLDKVLSQLQLSVQFYQDYENGTLNYRMETRLATTGTTKKMIKSLEPQEKAQHECNVIFFTPGQYKIDIQCSAPDNSTAVPCLPPSGHTWRFTPPVNVTVS